MTTEEIISQIDAEIHKLEQAKALLSELPATTKRLIGRPKKVTE